jgi:Bifunctional DNA primase/polymerase, N-terminal
MQTELGDLPVFPCSLDKRPLSAGGFKAAKQIEPQGFWPLVGVPTGATSGFDVLDIDPDGLTWLAEYPLRTRKHRTPRGFHLLFRHSEGVRCSAGRTAKGVDVRADGGFAIWWPRQGLEVFDAPLAEWPEEILTKLGEGRTTREHVNSADGMGSSHGAVATAVPTGSLKLRSKYLLLKLERTYRGNRNNCLHWAACRFGEMIGEGMIRREIAEHLLEQASRVNGLWSDSPGEVRATIKSGLDQGVKGWATSNQGQGTLHMLPHSVAIPGSVAIRKAIDCGDASVGTNSNNNGRQ